MEYIAATVTSIGVVEIVFFAVEELLKRKIIRIGGLIIFLLGIVVLNFAFVSPLKFIVNKTVNHVALNLLDVAYFFFLLFYSFIRGLSAIHRLKKKYS